MLPSWFDLINLCVTYICKDCPFWRLQSGTRVFVECWTSYIGSNRLARPRNNAVTTQLCLALLDCKVSTRLTVVFQGAFSPASCAYYLHLCILLPVLLYSCQPSIRSMIKADIMAKLTTACIEALQGFLTLGDNALQGWWDQDWVRDCPELTQSKIMKLPTWTV